MLTRNLSCLWFNIMFIAVSDEFLHSTTWPPIFYWTQQVNLSQEGVTADIVSCKQGLQSVDIYCHCNVKSHARAAPERKREWGRKKERKKEDRKALPLSDARVFCRCWLRSHSKWSALHQWWIPPLTAVLILWLTAKFTSALRDLRRVLNQFWVFSHTTSQPRSQGSLPPVPTENLLGTRLTTCMCAHLLKATSHSSIY